MELHWSVDFRSHQDSFDYEKFFVQTLSRGLKIKYPDSYQWCKKKYRILPNYWNGFSTHKENYRGAGSVEIEKRWNGSNWEINGVQTNTDSAEKISFCYVRGHGIEGDYQCVMENLHQDGYRKLELKGRIYDGMIKAYTIKGLPVIKGEVFSEPVYTNWCLLDYLPDQSFVLLENLDSCYSGVRLQKLEEWTFEKEQLMGYVLSGHGVPFTYYWVNKCGHVVIAAQTLMTYVLGEAEFSEEGNAWMTGQT